MASRSQSGAILLGISPGGGRLETCPTRYTPGPSSRAGFYPAGDLAGIRQVGNLAYSKSMPAISLGSICDPHSLE